MRLAIVMPAYNEAACIEGVVRGWLRLLDRVPGALFVVNDGSRDATGQVLDRLAAADPRLRVLHQANAGHGAAVLNGYQAAIAAGAEYVFQTDSDDQFEPEDFWSLWALRESAPCVLGYRAHRQDPALRLLITRLNALLCRACFGAGVRDANVPFRLLRADLLAGILAVLPPGVFAPNILIAVSAKLSGAPVAEVPVRHRERRSGNPSLLRWRLLRVCLRCTGELVDFRRGLPGLRGELRALGARAAAPAASGVSESGAVEPDPGRP